MTPPLDARPANPAGTRNPELTACVHCTAVIDPALGADPPGAHEGIGTLADPRAPGDWDNICDVCNYALGKRGGPDA